MSEDACAACGRATADLYRSDPVTGRPWRVIAGVCPGCWEEACRRDLRDAAHRFEVRRRMVREGRAA